MRTLISSALAVVVSAATLLAADLTITSKVTGKGAMAKDGSQVQYFSPTRIRTNHPGSKIDSLVDYGQEVLLIIDHDKKTVTKSTFKDLETSMQALEDQMSAMPEMVTKMMYGDVSEVKVEQLGPDLVLGRPCKKVRITIGKLVADLSLDPTLQIPVKNYGKAMAMLNRMPGQAGLIFKKLYDEMAKLKGVALKTQMKGLMGMDVTTEATEVSTAPIAASTWTIPTDYAQKEGDKDTKGKR